MSNTNLPSEQEAPAGWRQDHESWMNGSQGKPIGTTRNGRVVMSHAEQPVSFAEELRSLRGPFKISPKLLAEMREVAKTSGRFTITEVDYGEYFNGPQVTGFHCWATSNGLTIGPMNSATENSCAWREIRWSK